MLEEAKLRLTSFLKQLDEKDFQYMNLDTSVKPPLLVYENGKKFIAMDPAAGKVFIDKAGVFSVPFDFEGDTEIRVRVDRAGKSIMDKAKNEALSAWIQDMDA